MSISKTARVCVLAATSAGLLLTTACKAEDTAAPAVGAAPTSSSAPTEVDLAGSSSTLRPGTEEAPAGSGSRETAPADNVRRTTAPAENTRRTSDSGAGTGSRGGVFSGTRQVFLLPKNSEAGVGVVNGNRLGLTESFGDKDLFVIVPAGDDKYSIKTAKLRAGGEPWCVSAKLGRGGAPGPVVLSACDAAAPDQKFRFRPAGESNGKPTYTIRTGTNTYIVQDPTGDIAGPGTGVIAASIGEGTADIDTPFVLADKGRASLPTLD